jgi:hypothetical protein
MGTTFALSKLDFGAADPSAWKTIGFNLDNLVSTSMSTNLCQPNMTTDTTIPYPDGNMGIDNSFGKNLVPIIIGRDPTWQDDVNGSLQQGAFNVLLKLYCLPATGDAPSLTTKLFVASPLGTTPKFDGTDVWPVAPEFLTNPMDPQSSMVVFPNSSVTGNTFDSGSNQVFIITVPLSSNGNTTLIKLALYDARATMTLSADRKSATGGIIGGVLSTTDFVTEMKKVGYLLGLCGSPILDGLVTEAEQASDIMADGTQDTTKTCDGISIGISFEMKAVQLGGVGPASPMANTCP